MRVRSTFPEVGYFLHNHVQAVLQITSERFGKHVFSHSFTSRLFSLADASTRSTMGSSSASFIMVATLPTPEGGGSTLKMPSSVSNLIQNTASLFCSWPLITSSSIRTDSLTAVLRLVSTA